MTDKILAPESFIDAYIECGLWSESAYIDGENDDRSFQDHNYSGADLSTDAKKKIVEDCNDFYNANHELIEKAAEYSLNNDSMVYYGDHDAGHDFWLSRNGHGAGYFDRGLGSIGDNLQKAARAYGESHFYLNGDEVEYYG